MSIQRDGGFYTGGEFEVFVVYEEYYMPEDGDHRISLQLDCVYMYAHEADEEAMRLFEDRYSAKSDNIIVDEPGKHGLYCTWTEETFIYGVKKFKMGEL